MQHTKRKIKAGSFILMVLYMMILLYVCFLSEGYGRTHITEDYRYNLVPFREITRFWKYRDIVGISSFFVNLFGNIIAFAPFGFFLPILDVKCRKFWRVTGYTVLLSLTIEIIQLITRVGSCDVDDLILNTLGGICGYIIFAILDRIRRKASGT